MTIQVVTAIGCFTSLLSIHPKHRRRCRFTIISTVIHLLHQLRFQTDQTHPAAHQHAADQHKAQEVRQCKELARVVSPPEAEREEVYPITAALRFEVQRPVRRRRVPSVQTAEQPLLGEPLTTTGGLGSHASQVAARGGTDTDSTANRTGPKHTVCTSSEQV